MNPRLTLTEHQRRAEAVNNVLEILSGYIAEN